MGVKSFDGDEVGYLQNCDHGFGGRLSKGKGESLTKQLVILIIWMKTLNSRLNQTAWNLSI